MIYLFINVDLSLGSNSLREIFINQGVFRRIMGLTDLLPTNHSPTFRSYIAKPLLGLGLIVGLAGCPGEVPDASEFAKPDAGDVSYVDGSDSGTDTSSGDSTSIDTNIGTDIQTIDTKFNPDSSSDAVIDTYDAGKPDTGLCATGAKQVVQEESCTYFNPKDNKCKEDGLVLEQCVGGLSWTKLDGCFSFNSGTSEYELKPVFTEKEGVIDGIAQSCTKVGDKSVPDFTSYVLIKAGAVIVGDDNVSGSKKQGVNIGDFYMMITPVTNATWKGFVEYNMGSKKPEGTDFGDTTKQHFPVVGITYDMAKEFCEWVTDGLGRVPTAMEYEVLAWDPVNKVARKYVWGDQAPECGKHVQGKGQNCANPLELIAVNEGLLPENVSVNGGVKYMTGIVGFWTHTNPDAYQGIAGATDPGIDGLSSSKLVMGISHVVPMKYIGVSNSSLKSVGSNSGTLGVICVVPYKNL